MPVDGVTGNISSTIGVSQEDAASAGRGSRDGLARNDETGVGGTHHPHSAPRPAGNRKCQGDDRFHLHRSPLRPAQLEVLARCWLHTIRAVCCHLGCHS
ncbi:hypothetical protein BaRGS_00018298 [Batillaria attramentaria]|uniref:Uncharacterized protein n=1 Tax=Batillaria attramentaria TaxID=370345 RepID=A0ABD0KUP6_9CAEN